jgi:mannose-6-phosphate isomerase-like protein (cupin superfamily)
MAEKKYEKYIVRKAMRPADFLDPMAAGFMTMPPLIFLNGDNPVKGSNQFLEVVWIWAEGAAAVNPDRPPHSHEFDEVFVFLGSNREDPDDLGGEVEFWLGEGKDTEKYLFTTSTCIFVPKGLVHLPMIFRKIKRPFLLVTFGVNMGKEWVRAKAPRK